MTERDLTLDGSRRHRPVQAVEALEPRPDVVVTVRAGAVADALPRQLDLVGRVVVEVPRLGRLPQAELQGDRGHDECRGHREGCGDEHPGSPPAHRQPDQGQHDDAAPGEHRDRAEQTHVPALVRHPHEEGEQAVRRDGTGVKVPWVRAERADVEENNRRQRAEDDPRAVA